MELTHKRTNDILILSLDGDLIGENSGVKILEVVNDAINENVFGIAVDVENVRYMNSSGLGVLITLLTKVKNKGGEVALINPSDYSVKYGKLLALSKCRAKPSALLELLEQTLEPIHLTLGPASGEIIAVYTDAKPRALWRNKQGHA